VYAVRHATDAACGRVPPWYCETHVLRCTKTLPRSPVTCLQNFLAPTLESPPRLPTESPSASPANLPVFSVVNTAIQSAHCQPIHRRLARCAHLVDAAASPHRHALVGHLLDASRPNLGIQSQRPHRLAQKCRLLPLGLAQRHADLRPANRNRNPRNPAPEPKSSQRLHVFWNLLPAKIDSAKCLRTISSGLPRRRRQIMRAFHFINSARYPSNCSKARASSRSHPG